MISPVPIRTLRDKLSRYLDQVRFRDRTFVVSKNGEPIAKVVPLTKRDVREFQNNDKEKETK